MAAAFWSARQKADAVIGLKTSPFIDGAYVKGHGGLLKAVNPATEETLAAVEQASAEDVDLAVTAAEAALSGPWGRMPPEERGAIIDRLGDEIAKATTELAEVETRDMGKPLRESKANMARSVRTCRYYAGAADKIEGQSIPVGHNGIAFTLIEPLGVTAHITPWNYPFANAMRSLPTALAAGCTAVIKPASDTVLTTLMLGELCNRAGVPKGVVNIIAGSGSAAGASLAKHPKVRGITFTGSVTTGERIAAYAASPVRPTVLELGGKNPQIVFADCDLPQTVMQTVRGAFTNAGQVCTSVSRVLVERSIHDAFVEALSSALKKLSIGDGMTDPDLGPLVSASHRAEVEGFVAIARDGGGRLITGGIRPKGLERGFFYEPTLFDHITPDMRIAQEEVFGPLLVVMPFDTDEDALAIANSLSLGLTSGVFTMDVKRALRFVRDLKAGMVWVNEWFLSPVQVPHGGVKESGLGREQGLVALSNYTTVKSVAFRL